MPHLCIHWAMPIWLPGENYHKGHYTLSSIFSDALEAPEACVVRCLLYCIQSRQHLVLILYAKRQDRLARGL